MGPEDELAHVRRQVSILAERELGLLDMISKRTRRGVDAKAVEDRLALLESLMWKLHRRLMRLQGHNRAA